MTSIKNIACAAVAISAFFLTSCRREVDTGIMNTGNFTDTAGALKDFAAFPIGVAISHTPMTTEPRYANIVKRDFAEVVFEYHMKHGAVVKDDGTFTFTKTDELVNAVGANQIFGHVLGWHQNQNATYLKNFAGIVVPAATENLSNPGFESGLTNWSTFNSGNPSGTSTITTGGTGETRTGTGSMKVINPVGYPGSQWRVQVASQLVPTVVGRQYTFSYWVRTTGGAGSIRLSTSDQSGGNAQYQGDQTINGTIWQQISFTITANTAQTRFLFDMGQAAATYLIDDASFKEVIATSNPTQIAAKLDEALKTFINTMVGRYKSKVKAWDVINELFTGDGSIRNNGNTANTASDVLVWSNYMGKDFAFKAFQYAKEADPTADLYINDFNLEVEPRKLDSLIAFVNEMKGKGLKVDGIGTQMHIAWNTNWGTMEQMFQKLGATGLKIRISELDIKTVAGSAALPPTPITNGYQAAMAQFVVEKYLQYIAPDKRAGITIWGVNDANSWLWNGGKEYALFYDNDFWRKNSYSGFLQGLRNGRAK